VDRIWAPWRGEYVESAKDRPENEECLFCRVLSGEDADGLILVRAGLAFAMLNAYPYNPGHVMVAPLRHVGELEAVEAPELADVDELLQRSTVALTSAYSPHGFNLGVNLGRVAGAGVPGHLHWHVVPRWNGDTNFMPVVGETRVLPEALSATYERLRPLFRRD
jgi:ATP adenylyltransferase